MLGPPGGSNTVGLFDRTMSLFTGANVYLSVFVRIVAGGGLAVLHHFGEERVAVSATDFADCG